MKMNLKNTKRFSQAASVCAAIAALGLFAAQASAMDISGLVKVNGTDMPGVLIGYYDCADGAFLGAVQSGATDSSSGAPSNFSITTPSENIRLELYYHPTPDQVPLADQCRTFVDCGEILPVNGLAMVSLNMACDFSKGDCDKDQPGVRSPGYWKNHSEQWPVDSITMGGRIYTKLQAIALMRLPEKGDKTKSVFRHLVAARLNVIAGNDDSCIADAIEAADAWLMRFPICSRVKASSSQWKRISASVSMLDDYNNGLLCAPKQDGDTTACDNGDDDKADDHPKKR